MTVLADQTPAPVEAHPFSPRDRWWDLCVHCGLAEPSHTETILTRPNGVCAMDPNLGQRKGT